MSGSRTQQDYNESVFQDLNKLPSLFSKIVASKQIQNTKGSQSIEVSIVDTMVLSLYWDSQKSPLVTRESHFFLLGKFFLAHLSERQTIC